MATMAGCSEISGLGVRHHSLGDTVNFDGVEVTVTDSMTARELAITISESRHERSAPPNGVFGLFYVEAFNTDFSSREGPAVNITNYEIMEDRDDRIEIGGVNDIRVYGSGEGGHLPEIRGISMYPYGPVAVNGNQLDLYPRSITGTGPNIPPESRAEGWVFAVIPRDSTPELRVITAGKSATWSAEGEPLDTPTESGNTTVSF